jgi:OPA family glycerol-3-phosphate transporter-like MFS transporter 1/2
MAKASPTRSVSPFGIELLPTSSKRNFAFQRGLMLVLTFLTYMMYHATRKPNSIVKSTLASEEAGWAPFNASNGAVSDETQI